MYQPPPQIAYQPAPVVSSGWYLRGDVGVGIQTFGDFPHSQTNSAFVWPASWAIVQKDIQDTSIFGGGIGYEWNNWFRTDVTAEYRTKAAFKATGSYSGAADFCAVLRRHRGQLLVSRVHGQCLSRSRHLVVHHAVYRRGHRQCL
jgi:opacity protein-like surface antigen